MTAATLIPWLVVICLVAPLGAAAVIIVLTRRVIFKAAGWFATATSALTFLAALIALIGWWGGTDRHAIVVSWPWIQLGTSTTGATWLYLGVLYDDLTAAMLVMVTGVSALVHLYSIGYMAGDKRYNLFFAYLSLFAFSMLGIVVANSLIMLFVFWELVGLTSYLLIGFWFERRGPQQAAKKAFVMNRIGDAGFLVGFGILFYQLGGKVLLPAAAGHDANMFDAILAALGPEFSFADPPAWLTAAGIGLFFGAMGKSAQFPLHTWLPDAMEGPTPVSSIVHSATMVAAGVYLTGRIYPILTPQAHLFIATIGLITLVMAAFMALVMTDIKRVLAYSTLSQLGYMVLALGVGAWTFALYHLITHAFFKCCLFQCSGSVIRAMHHEQDMRRYGGLFKKLPVTGTCYMVSMLAIAGASIPFTAIGLSGFYSKDGIIAGAFNYGNLMQDAGWWGSLFWLGPVVIALVTPFYMARSFALTFMGTPRDPDRYSHAHEAGWTMVVPQVILAFMAVVAGWFFFKDFIVAAEQRLDPTNAGMVLLQPASLIEAEHGAHRQLDLDGMHRTHTVLLHGITWIVMIAAGLLMYRPGFKHGERIASLPVIRLLHHWAYNKFYFDALYDLVAIGLGKAVAHLAYIVDTYIVDALANLAAALTRWAAWGAGAVDHHVVDGAVNGAAAVTHHGGQLLRQTHAGRIRSYVLTLVATTALVMTTVLIIVILRP